MKSQKIILIALLLVALLAIAPVSADIWTASGTCWTYTDGSYKVVKWNNTVVSNSWQVPAGVSQLQILVVGGGASGGVAYGGGGGAGGVINRTITVTPLSGLTALVGYGGAPATGASAGNNGYPSTFGTPGGTEGVNLFTATNGGYGGHNAPGGDGGSGGGGQGNGQPGGAGNTPARSPSQGTNGGAGNQSTVAGQQAGGGGGGFTSNGTPGWGINTVAIGGKGGLGLSTDIVQSGVYQNFSCGGGGGTDAAAPGYGGLGGCREAGNGGVYGSYEATNAINESGSGGGGGWLTSGRGGNGVIIVRYLDPTAGPIATFTGTNMSIALANSSTALTGYTPFTVQFTNTTVKADNITSFVWNATPIDTGIPFTFNSTSAFPQYTFTQVNNYSIKLNVSGTAGNNISTQVFWVNTTFKPAIQANFTANTTTQTIPSGAIAFTDTSLYAPDAWIWTFGDGTTSTLQNPTHVYNSSGLKTVSLTAYSTTNATDVSAITKTDYINLTYSPFYNHPDFSGNPTSGTPGLLVSFTDLTVYGNISAPRTCNWSFGDSFSATPYSATCGNVQHVYTYGGIYDVNLSVTTYGNTTYELKQSYIAVSNEQNQKLNVLYPHEVRLIAVDVYGNRLRNVSVSSVMINSTTDGTNWFSYLYGISPTATAVEGTEVSGFTDTYGSVVFPMLGSGDYQLTFVSAEYGISQIHRLHPEENSYTIVLATSSTVQALNSGDYITQNLSVFESSPNVYLNMSYNDTSLSTTNINFFVDFANRTRVYTKNYPGTATTNQSINTSYSVTNTNGVAYVWGYSAYSTLFGWQNMSQGITLKGPTGMFYNPFEYKGRW